MYLSAKFLLEVESNHFVFPVKNFVLNRIRIRLMKLSVAIYGPANLLNPDTS